MRFLFVFFIVILTVSIAYGKTEKDSLFQKLDYAIARADNFDAEKQKKIEGLINSLRSIRDPIGQYHLYGNLYEEYKLFNFDTAFNYAKKLEKLAGQLKDPSKIVASRNKLAFVLLSAGLYKEAYDYLMNTQIEGQPDSLQAEFYASLGRYYYDLGDYNNDHSYTPEYVAKGNLYIDSALKFYPETSIEHIYYTGLRQLKEGNLDKAFTSFQLLIDLSSLSRHQLAVVASTLSFIYQARGDVNTAIAYQAKAAIADIESSTKETFATLSLSQLLFNQGDFKRASVYIKKAIEDATFYGARQRKVQVSAILPIIQSSEINYVNNQRRAWILYGTIVSIAVLLLVALLITIFRQNKRLKLAKQVITQAHQELHTTNTKLQVLNEELKKLNSELLDVNNKLLEANKIKEEYIGQFFTNNSIFFHKIEKFKKAIEQKVNERKIDEIRFLVNNINIKDEKDALLKNFDKAFLKFFPHFVEEFNALFKTEDQIHLHDGELLNTDLRIYALIRLGIKENEKIAEILEYSIKSIYAYKTKIRNRAIYPREEFEKHIMAIKSI